MITPYRPPSHTKISLNVANIRQRHNPTNTHTRIFNFEPITTTTPVKCSPTFHSQIFTNPPQKPRVTNPSQPTTVIYRNNTREQRQISLNPGMKEGDGVGVGLKEFQDNSKLKLLTSIPKNNRFARAHKIAEQFSAPIIDLGGKEVTKKHLNYDMHLPTGGFD